MSEKLSERFAEAIKAFESGAENDERRNRTPAHFIWQHQDRYLTALRLAESHPSAIRKAVEEEEEACAKITREGCLVPPDGGSPTEAESDMCERIAAAILARERGMSDELPMWWKVGRGESTEDVKVWGVPVKMSQDSDDPRDATIARLQAELTVANSDREVPLDHINVAEQDAKTIARLTTALAICEAAGIAKAGMIDRLTAALALAEGALEPFANRVPKSGLNGPQSDGTQVALTGCNLGWFRRAREARAAITACLAASPLAPGEGEKGC